MNTLQVLSCSIVILMAVSVIAYMITDAVLFFRAINHARKQGGLAEWFNESGRLEIGSGFRLYRKYGPAKK